MKNKAPYKNGSMLDYFSITGRPSRPANLTPEQGLSLAGSIIQEQANFGSIDLRYLQLSRLPPEIKQAQNAISLNLGNNRFREFPPELFSLRNLRSLYIQANEMTQIPDEIAELLMLENLYCSHNSISYVSSEISRLRSLHVIDLSWNRLTTIPDAVCKLTKLHDLSLHNNEIEIVQPAIRHLSSLVNLDLSNNKIDRLPDSMADLRSLTNLVLENNKLKHIPISLGEIDELEDLWLEGNPLDKDAERLLDTDGFPGISLNHKAARRIKRNARLDSDYVPAIPAEKAGPRFGINSEMKIDLDEVNTYEDLEDVASMEEIVANLRSALEDVIAASGASNAFVFLHTLALKYRGVLDTDDKRLHVDSIYSAGLRLSTAHFQTKKEIESGEMPAMPLALAEAVDTTLALHGIAIASTPRGRHLLERSRYYNTADRNSAQIAELASKLAVQISNHSALFSPLARDITTIAAIEIDRGPYPERSRDEALRTNFNLLQTAAKVVVGSALTTNMLAAAFIDTQPGAFAVHEMAAMINRVWEFWVTNSDMLTAFAMSCGAEFYWIQSVVNWVLARRKHRTN